MSTAARNPRKPHSGEKIEVSRKSKEEVLADCPPGYASDRLYLYQASETLAGLARDACAPHGVWYATHLIGRGLPWVMPVVLLAIGIKAWTSIASAGIAQQDGWRFFEATTIVLAAIALAWHAFQRTMDAAPWVLPTGVFQLSVTQHGLPISANQSDLLASVQNSLTERIGLWLAGLAARGTIDNQLEVPIASAETLNAFARNELLDSLGMNPEHSELFLTQLFAELREAAQQNLIRGAWGELKSSEGRLWLDLRDDVDLNSQSTGASLPQ